MQTLHLYKWCFQSLKYCVSTCLIAQKDTCSAQFKILMSAVIKSMLFKQKNEVLKAENVLLLDSGLIHFVASVAEMELVVSVSKQVTQVF